MVKSLVIVIVTRGRCDENDDDDNDGSSMYTSENIDHVDNLFTLVTVGSFIWTFSLKRNSRIEKSIFRFSHRLSVVWNSAWHLHKVKLICTDCIKHTLVF